MSRKSPRLTLTPPLSRLLLSSVLLTHLVHGISRLHPS